MEKDTTSAYTCITKEEAKSILYFDKTNYETWKNPKIPCNDLLSVYAEKPSELEFVKCKIINENQILVEATYRVSGEKSKVVEDFLVKNYNMGNLRWDCCGWDIAGNYGGFNHPAFKEIHEYCLISISMYGSAEVPVDDDPSEVRLEFDRNKIESFYVRVELGIV